MPPKPPHIPLTLIVAVTPNLGIGANGQLPWRIKSEIQYFARVTTRVPASLPQTPRLQNAVIMGRKTWESIPKKFRPLKGRVNVVLSSGAEGKPADGATWVKSMEAAMNYLSGLWVNSGESKEELDGAENEESPRVARAFVIGGAALYKAALDMPETERVLLTEVQGDHWGCDTFFPVQLERTDGKEVGWKRKSDEQLSAWVGEDVPSGLVKEGDVEFQYCMYEKEQS